MNINDIYPRKYANGEDLKGKAVSIVIASVKPERMRPNPSASEVMKLVLYAEGAQKGIIVSRTMAEQIAKVLQSEETETWIGKRIVIYPENMKVAGTERVAIRARFAGVQTDPLPAALQDEEEMP